MLRGPRADPHVIFAALAVAGLSYAVSQTMLIPALPDIEAAFGTTPNLTTVLMSAFWVSGAVTAGLFGRLGDMFGKRRLIAIQLTLFNAGALICAFSPSLELMILGRVLMGSAVGLFPLAYALIRDELPPQRVVGSIALLAGLIAGGAALGQSLGGLVADSFGFRMIFVISLLLGIVSTGALVACVPESAVRHGGRVDFVGAVLFAGGLAAPLIAITQTPSWGWIAAPTLGLLVVGAVLLVCFAVYERRVDEPLIDIPTLLLPRIRLTNAATFLVGFGFLGASTILSQFFREPASTGYGMGADATQAGLYLAPGLVLLTITSPLAGRLSSRVGPVLTLRLGVALSTLGLAAMTVSHTHEIEMYLWPALMYLGIGAAVGAMPAIVLQSVPASHSGQSAAINMVLRTAGSAVGVQLAATLTTMSVSPTGAPTDRGYTVAFAVATGAGIVALVVALLIPRRLPRASESSFGRLAVDHSTPI
jgi:MFS family permease